MMVLRCLSQPGAVMWSPARTVVLTGTGARVQAEPGELSMADKAAGLGSVFKREDSRLAAMREQDEREKVPPPPTCHQPCCPAYVQNSCRVCTRTCAFYFVICEATGLTSEWPMGLDCQQL